MQVLPSSIHGVGLFTDTNVKKGELICCTTVQENGKWVNNKYGNATNHSEQPNSKEKLIGNEIWLFALEDIEKDTEVIINYNNWSLTNPRIKPFP